MSEPQTARRGVQRITRVSLPVADLAGTAEFYERALGFRRLRRKTRAGRGAEAVLLGLGREEIELVRFDPPGAPYPAPRSASVPWFQHFAIVVSDMPCAYAQLCAHGGAEPISEGGPQLLPPSTGAVTAYKFRDPEGHPLELLFYPRGVGSSRWQARDRVFLGIDHSGIVVADLDASVAFYRDLLGFAVAPVLVNSGSAQARLDGLADPVVDIVSVSPPVGAHIELLAYRGIHAPGTGPPSPNDIAATELVIKVFGLRALRSRLATAFDRQNLSPFQNPERGRAVLCRDPDGHLLRLEEASLHGD